MTRAHLLSVLVLGTAIAGCSEQPLLVDLDGGTGDPDAPVLPDATANDAPLGVRGLVAVCTPFRGSRRARYLFVPSIRALLPTDETIVMLGRESSVNGRIVSIFGQYDPHIPDGSVLEGATNVRVPGFGHFRLLGAPQTHRAVIDGVAQLAAT